MSSVEGEPGTWSHCGKQSAHSAHTHTVIMNEGPYPDVLCRGTHPELASDVEDVRPSWQKLRDAERRINELEEKLARTLEDVRQLRARERSAEELRNVRVMGEDLHRRALEGWEKSDMELRRHQADMKTAIKMLQKPGETRERTAVEREVAEYLTAALVPVFTIQEQLENAPASAECAHEDQQMDRTLCGVCHAMHFFCNECGMQMDECDERA